jgi:Ca-activated chloride channel homolog
MRVEVDLQPVDVQVKDSQGNDVPGLSAKDFAVLENGQRQKIAFFDAGSGPVSIAILVDSSSSMNSNGQLGSPQAIAAQFMRTARPEDEISVMGFTNLMGAFQRLTREQLLNPSTAKLAPASSDGSALYDAIATALCHLNRSKNPRQAIIVISDGVDEHSRISLEQLVGLVRSSRAQLFMIGLQSRSQFNFQGHTEPRLTLVNGHDIDNPIVVFDHLMKESGAESFIPNSRSHLDEALRAVSNMLQSEYTLAYYPQKGPREFRKIEVKVDRRGTHVLARRFVGSDQMAMESVHFDEAACTVSPKYHPYPYEANLTRGPSGMTYRERFSDPHSGWPVHEDSHYVSGGYELSNSQQTGLFDSSNTLIPVTSLNNVVVAAYGPWWINFHASANLAVPDDAVAGLVFRMSQHGYYALLISGSRKRLSAELVETVFRGNAYTQKPIVPWTTVMHASGSAAEISVDDIGSEISMFVDGQQFRTVQDDTFRQGLVGFAISGPGHVTFKNLDVEQR